MGMSWWSRKAKSPLLIPYLIRMERGPKGQLLLYFIFVYTAAGGVLVPRPGMNPCPLQWKPRVLPNRQITRECPFSPLMGQLLKQSLFRVWGGLRQWIGEDAHCWRQSRLFSLCKGHLGCTHHQSRHTMLFALISPLLEIYLSSQSVNVQSVS